MWRRCEGVRHKKHRVRYRLGGHRAAQAGPLTLTTLPLHEAAMTDVTGVKVHDAVGDFSANTPIGALGVA
jgi:hypothetical protein